MENVTQHHFSNSSSSLKSNPTKALSKPLSNLPSSKLQQRVALGDITNGSGAISNTSGTGKVQRTNSSGSLTSKQQKVQVHNPTTTSASPAPSSTAPSPLQQQTKPIPTKPRKSLAEKLFKKPNNTKTSGGSSSKIQIPQFQEEVDDIELTTKPTYTIPESPVLHTFWDENTQSFVNIHITASEIAKKHSKPIPVFPKTSYFTSSCSSKSQKKSAQATTTSIASKPHQKRSTAATEEEAAGVVAAEFAFERMEEAGGAFAGMEMVTEETQFDVLSPACAAADTCEFSFVSEHIDWDEMQ